MSVLKLDLDAALNKAKKAQADEKLQAVSS